MAQQQHPLAKDLTEIMQHVGTTWEQFRGARIFLTGGTGFFGRWLLESFVHANREHTLGASMVVLSRNPQGFVAQAPHLVADGAVTFHRGDVRRFTPPEGAFTHIIHAATESCGSQKSHDRLYMIDTVVDGTRNVLEFARAAKAKRVLNISSAAIYGRNRPFTTPVSETDATAPLLTDGDIDHDESKRMAEALCTVYFREYGVPVTTARCFSFVGPYLPLDAHFAIGNFIRDALAGDPITLKSDGSPVRSYLYMSDLITWLWTILAKGEAGKPYNVGSDKAVSVAELARQVQQTLHPGGKVELGKSPAGGSPTNFQVPDTARAQALGLSVTVPLAEAIRRTAEWHRNTPPQPKPAYADTAASILARPDVVIFDFDGVMTDNRVAVLQDGREAVFCNRSDGLGIGMLKKLGVPMLVLSTEANPVVAARCKKLGLECMQDIAVKEEALAKWLKARGYAAERTIYLGNDVNDLGCLKLVGLPVSVGDAYPEAKAVSQLVLTRHGGKGAVRELCDMIVAAAA